MTTTDIRNDNWQQLRGKLAGTRETIHGWLLCHGPATTEAIALGTGIGLLTVRPRVSELVAWGFAQLAGRHKHEGLYEALTVLEAQARHEAARREAQMNLML